MNGKVLRLKRFMGSPSGKIVILPLDHGVSCGVIPGLEDMDRVIRLGIEGGADAFVLHKGMMRFLEPMTGALPGVFMHLSASTQLGPSFHRKVLVGTVEEAIRRGADGVSLHVNLGNAHESEMLEDFGRVGAACSQWQVPLLVMIYVRGSTALASPPPDSAIVHCARLAAELGADLIKIPNPQDDGALQTIVSSIPVPVVLAGGSKQDEPLAFLERVGRALHQGIRGVAIGRNVFQRQEPDRLLRAVSHMVHQELSPGEAWERTRGHD